MSTFFKSLLNKQPGSGAGSKDKDKDKEKDKEKEKDKDKDKDKDKEKEKDNDHRSSTSHPVSSSSSTAASPSHPLSPSASSSSSSSHSRNNSHTRNQTAANQSHEPRSAASTPHGTASASSSFSSFPKDGVASILPLPISNSSALPSSSSASKYLSKLKDYSLLMEFKKLKHQSPTGVYVMPSATSLRRWDGVIFLRRGYYRKGIFRFVIHLPANYPDAAPLVTFLSEVFHPLIKKDSGELDLSIQFPVWKPSEHYIIVLLVYMKRIFYKPEIWEKKFASKEKQPFNLLAYTMWHRDKISYARKCEQCCMRSLDGMYKNPVDSSLRLGKPVAAHEEVYRRIVSQDDILDSETHDGDNQINYLSWFVDGVHKLNSSIDSVLTRNSAPSAQALPPV